MTRTLSDLLRTDEASLRLQLSQLERANGHQNTDIKLSVEVMQAVKQKVHALGLDKHDTTAEELYHVLQQRVSEDDARLERALRTRAASHVSAEANIIDGIVHALQAEVSGVNSLALKSATVKRLLKKLPPKRVTKALGYRSLDAMLRQESPSLVVAAAQHLESAAWRKSWLDAYKQLKTSDFESRTLQILHPSSSKWQTLAPKITEEQAQTVLSLPEMGALIILPLPEHKPQGMIIATMALAIHELNTLEAAANYIRAAQVEADFGARIKAVASGNVQLATPNMPQAMPWQLLQRYFATTKRAISEDIFGPYVQSVDFNWHNVEATLTRLCPALAFWEQTAHLTFVHNGQAVSLNLLDAAINCCNKVAYEIRSAYHAQRELWNELCLRYIDHDSIQRDVAGLLHPQLAYEPALNK